MLVTGIGRPRVIPQLTHKEIPSIHYIWDNFWCTQIARKELCSDPRKEEKKERKKEREGGGGEGGTSCNGY